MKIVGKRFILTGILMVSLFSLNILHVSAQDSTYISTSISLNSSYRTFPFYLDNGSVILITWEMAGADILEMFLLKGENYGAFLDSDAKVNPVLDEMIYDWGKAEIFIDNSSSYYLVFRNNVSNGFQANLNMWIYQRTECECSNVTNTYVNNTTNEVYNNYYENCSDTDGNGDLPEIPGFMLFSLGVFTVIPIGILIKKIRSRNVPDSTKKTSNN